MNTHQPAGATSRRRGWRAAAVMALGLLVVLGSPAIALATIGDTFLGSLDSAGVQANNESWGPGLPGSMMVFSSDASNLVAGDTNSVTDIFVKYRYSGGVRRVSVGSAGEQANDASAYGKASADGRYVVFESMATNLVPNDINGQSDVFVYDLVASRITRVSVSSSGEQGNGSSREPDISADGRYVVFSSDATNLVSTDGNGAEDIFVRDMVSGTTRRVSVRTVLILQVPIDQEANSFSAAPSISADGRYVTFESNATNLVLDDTNGRVDVFVRDIQSRTPASTTRASLASDGAEGNARSDRAAISSDGRYVAFGSLASNLVPGDTNGYDIFVRDRTAGTTVRAGVSQFGMQANAECADVSISGDGNLVAFQSAATNLVLNDTNGVKDVFVRNLSAGTTQRVSVSSSGEQANASCEDAMLSPDGRYVAFGSAATNLVPNDVNNKFDIFVHQFGLGGTQIGFEMPDGFYAAYMQKKTISAQLIGEFRGPQAAESLVLQKESGGTWVDLPGAFFTDAAGRAQMAFAFPAKTVIRARYGGKANAWTESVSATMAVTPSAYLSKPNARKTMRKNRYYTLSGTLKPKHAKGKIVRIYKYKKVKVGGKWVWKDKGYVKAKVYNPKGKSYSKFRARVRLTSKGSWRIVYRMMPDSTHADTLSKVDSVKVK